MKVITEKYLTDMGGIINLRGKKYVTHNGLVAAAHANGIKSIITELVSYETETGEAIVFATAEGERGRFTGIGDASPKNVGKMIANATIRMAETRAVNRSLRLYLGCGITSIDELPGDDQNRNGKTAKPRTENRPAPKQIEPPKEEEEETGFRVVVEKPKEGHHPTFDGKEQKRFFAILKEIGVTYEKACEICEERNNPRPSQMPQSQRNNCLKFLRNNYCGQF